MKAVTLTVTFAGCLDGCPYAEGADRAMCPIFCTLSSRQVVGHSSKSSEILAGTAHPPWCELPDREVDAGVRLAEVRACISCPHYAGIGDCGWPESRETGFSRRHLRAVDIEAAHAGVPMDCPLPKAGRAEREIGICRMSAHEYLCNAPDAVPTPSRLAPRRSPGGGCSGTSAKAVGSCSGSRTGRTTMPGLDLTPTLRVHPVGTIAVRDRNGSTVL